MTPDELRAIDAQIAEAMGYTVIPAKTREGVNRKGIKWVEHHPARITLETSALNYIGPLPHHTTDWAAAGQVVEWIGNQGKFYIELYNDASGYSLDLIPIRLEDEADFVCGDRAPTAPLAICLAFLQAVGAEVPSE